MALVLHLKADEIIVITYFTFFSHLSEHTLSQYAMVGNLTSMYSCHIEKAFPIFFKSLDVLHFVSEKVYMVFVQYILHNIITFCI